MKRVVRTLLVCFVAYGCFATIDDDALWLLNAQELKRQVTSAMPTFDESSLTDLLEPMDAQRGCAGHAKFADGRPVSFAFLVFRLTPLQPPTVKAVSDHRYVSTVTDSSGQFTLTLPASEPFTGSVAAVDGRAGSIRARWETAIERVERGKPLELTFDNRYRLKVVVNVAKPVPQLELTFDNRYRLKAVVNVAMPVPQLSTLRVKLVMNSVASGEHEITSWTRNGAGTVDFGDLSPGEYCVIVQAFHPQYLFWTKTVTIGEALDEDLTIEIPEMQFGELHVHAVEPDGTTPVRWGEVRVASLDSPSARWSFQSGVAKLKDIPAGDQEIVISASECRPRRVSVKVIANTTTALDPLTMETDPQATAAYSWNSPNANEKTPAEWFSLFENAQTPAARAEAASALGKLRSNDPEILGGLISTLYSRDEKAHSAAVSALYKYGPTLDHALDDFLIFAMRQHAVENNYPYKFHFNSGTVLSGLQESALAPLMVCLSDSREIVRENAIGSLGQLGPRAKPAVPLLRLIVANRRSPLLRAMVASALSNITGDDAATIAILVKSLQLPITQAGVSISAAESLAKFGPRAKPAVPYLIPILTGERENYERENDDRVMVITGSPFPWYHVRAIAAETLGRIGPDAKEAIPSLLDAAQLHVSDPGQDENAAMLRVQAARALSRIDPNNPKTIVAVRSGFQEASLGDYQRRWWQMKTAETIAEMGPAAKDAVPDLIALLQSKDFRAARQSAVALRAIGPDAAAATNALADALTRSEIYVAEEAAIALGSIGPKAKAALPKMKAVLATRDNSLDKVLSEAIRKIEQASAP